MLTLPRSVRIYLATGPTDMRKGFDGLSALVRRRRKDVYSGHLFVFVSRKGLRRVLWLLFLFTIPLPYYVGAAEFAPAARLVFLATLLGSVGAAEGMGETTGLFILLSLVEAALALALTYLLARLAAWLLHRQLRPSARLPALVGAALILLALSLFEIYETPISSTRAYSNLLHIFE